MNGVAKVSTVDSDVKYQARVILKDAQRKYGNGWQYMSEDARVNYLHSRVLLLCFAQHDPSDGTRLMERAQQIVRELEGAL